MADFDVLLHDDPGDGFCQRGRGQRAVVRPVVLGVSGQQAAGVEAGKLDYAVLQGAATHSMKQTWSKNCLHQQTNLQNVKLTTDLIKIT